MKRRNFLQNTALCAVAVSTTGFIQFTGEGYTGDCETTTDILGPYYRPDAPLRTNLVHKEDSGQEVILKGIVRHKDCITPYKGAKVELWHCDPGGQYDNTSSAFRYRATTLCDEQGRYEFLTLLPVPYDDQGNGVFRPAHFHLLISAPGYQSLVTQLYFSGDPHLSTDPYAASSTAKSRILTVEPVPEGRKQVSFNVTMTEKRQVEPRVIDRLTGIYIDENDKTLKTEFFKRGGQLWRKSGRVVYGLNYDYIGNNTFIQSGLPAGLVNACAFEFLPYGAVKMTRTQVTGKGVKTVNVAFKDR
ncbi:dioxygenase family protein [Spirosoma gilvum]